MAAEHATELDWLISTSGHPADQLSLAIPSTPAAGHHDGIPWPPSSAVQPETPNAATSHSAEVWDQLQRRTGSGNSSLDSGVTSRVESSANCESSSTGGCSARSYEQSATAGGAAGPEVTSEITTGSEEQRVFTDVDYQVLCGHVMQGDLDDHVIDAADRKSLDSRRKLYSLSVAL